MQSKNVITVIPGGNMSMLRSMLLAAALAGSTALLTLPAQAQNDVRLLYPPPVTAMQVRLVIVPPGPMAAAPDNPQATPNLVVKSEPARPTWAEPPAFEDLDRNHDGENDRSEANHYALLANDFEYATEHAKTVSRQRYLAWSRQAGVP